MSSRSRWGVVLVLSLLVAQGGLDGCGRESDIQTSQSVVAEWKIGSAPLASIGQVSGDPSYLFSHIAAVRLLPAGQVLVADRSSGTLRVFSRTGRLERQMGRLGQGPGEFQYLSDVSFVAPDTLCVYDAAVFRLTRFLLDGRVLETVTFHVPDGNPEIYVGSFSDGSYALAWIHQGDRDWSKLSADAMRIGRFARDGTFSQVIATGWGMRRLHSPVPFSPTFLAVLLRDRVYSTDGVKGRMNLTEARGGPPGTFMVSAKAWTFREAVRGLAPVLDSTGEQRLASMKGTAGLDTIPTISDMMTGEGGHLWIKEYNPATDSYMVSRNRAGGEWDVIKPDGTRVARVSVPKGVRLMDVRGDRVAGVRHDDLGIEYVEVFALHRGSR